MNLTSVNSEQAMIGSVLINPDVYHEVSHVTPADMYLHKHRWIWEAIGRMAASNSAIDIITLTSELDRQNKLAEVGGTAYLALLLTEVPTSVNAAEYARTVKQESKRRRVLELANDMAKVAQAEGDEFDRALNTATESLLALQSGDTEIQHMASLMSKVYGKLQLTMADPESNASLPTDLLDLDAAVEFIPGELVVLPGESGVGKTILALQWAQAWAEHGYPGAVFEMELSALQLGRRLSSAKSKVEVKKIRHGKLSETEMENFIAALDQLSRLDVWVSESTQWNTITLRSAVTRLKYERGIKWFVLDYFDLLQDNGEDANMRDTTMARNLKSMCKDLEVCGVVIHTLNKTGGVSGSNKIIYAADNVLALSAVQDMPNLARITPRKIRDDSNKGSVDLVRLPNFPAFGNKAKF